MSVLSSARMNQRHLGGNTCWPSSFYYEFSESVVVAGTSYQMLGILAFYNRERCFPPSITMTMLIVLVKKSTMKNSGASIFLTIREKTLNQISYS